MKTFSCSGPAGKRSAFSLIEVVIAIGVVATAVLPILALLAGGLDRSGTLTEQAERMFSELTDSVREMGATEIMNEVNGGTAHLALYQIRVAPGYVEVPGTFPSSTDLRPGGGTHGADYILHTVVRRGWDSAETAAYMTEANSIEAPALLVELTEETGADFLSTDLGANPTYPVHFLHANFRNLPIGIPATNWEGLISGSVSRDTLPLVLRP